LVVVTDGKMGMARQHPALRLDDKAGKPQEVTVRVTDVFQKLTASGRSPHAHLGAYDPKTGMTQTNLKS